LIPAFTPGTFIDASVIESPRAGNSMPMDEPKVA
jgi:hypothetical protein